MFRPKTKFTQEASRYKKDIFYQALQKPYLCHNDKVKSLPGALWGDEQGSALTPESHISWHQRSCLAPEEEGPHEL